MAAGAEEVTLGHLGLDLRPIFVVGISAGAPVTVAMAAPRLSAGRTGARRHAAADRGYVQGVVAVPSGSAVSALEPSAAPRPGCRARRHGRRPTVWRLRGRCAGH